MDGLNSEAFATAFKAWQNQPPFNNEFDAARALAAAINVYLALAPARYVKLPENVDEGRARPVQPTVEEWNAKALRDGFPNKIEWIRAYRQARGTSLKDSKDAYERNEPFSATPKTDPYALLERCRTVLGNMAMENPGSWFFRWPIHHEPLRADARELLPLIDAAIGDAS